MADTPYDYTDNLNIGLFHDGDFPGEVELNSFREKVDDLCPLTGLDADKPLPASVPVNYPPVWYVATDTDRLYLITSTQTILVASLSAIAAHTHPASDIVDFDTEVSNNTDVTANSAHRVNTSNPHSVTKTQVSLGNVPDLDTTDAVNNEHTHSNKAQLDLVTDGDHDVRTDNPHSVTKTQISLSNVTDDAQLKRSGNDWSGFDEKTVLHNDDLVLIEDSEASGVKKKVKRSNIGGSEKPYDAIRRPAGAWSYLDSAPAPEERDVGTYGGIRRHLFDDTTEEFLETIFDIPSDIDTSGTVYFIAYGYAVTWVTGKNIQLKAYHSAKADDESWDGAFGSVSSGDKALNTIGQDVIDRLSWSETVATLGWSANDQVRFLLSRIDATADDLSGDWGLTYFLILIPRA